MIGRVTSNGRQEVKETAPEVKGQANLRQRTKWIHRHCAAWNATEQRAGKGRNAAGITVPIVAVLVAQEVIAVEVFPAVVVVVVLGVVVAGANGIREIPEVAVTSSGAVDVVRERRRACGSLLSAAPRHIVDSMLRGTKARGVSPCRSRRLMNRTYASKADSICLDVFEQRRVLCLSLHL